MRISDWSSDVCSSVLSCWVRPGVLDTRASAFCWHSALSALDLPALERPANATSWPPSGGSWRGVWAASRYLARASGLDIAQASHMVAAARRGGRGLTGLAARDDNSRFKRVLFAPAPPRRPGPARGRPRVTNGIRSRSAEHTSELQSLMR